jgi:hypothetical protein
MSAFAQAVSLVPIIHVAAESAQIWWQREKPLSCQILEHSYQPTSLTPLSVLAFVSMTRIIIVWTDRAN